MPTDSSRRRRRLVALAVVLLAAAVVVTTGILERRSQAQQLQQRAAAQMVRTVSVVAPAPMPDTAMALPGRIEPWARAPIYARVSGYLKRWHVDIGARVKAGQVLAEIESPDLDQQLLQARAELATASSNAALAATTAQRWQSLLETASVSKQEVDERTGDLAAKQSIVNALQANVERLQVLQRYTRLVAPFDGTVTAHNTDVGALINAGGGASAELFVVSDIQRLRVYVSVPQRQVAMVRPGSVAQVAVPERPGEVHQATVQSLSRAINGTYGAMLVQLAVDNNGGATLLPGGFAMVRFAGGATAGGWGLPPGALIFGREGPRVAVVDAQQRVRLRPVTLGRDLGSVVEVATGLQGGERVIDSPPDGLVDGDPVQVAAQDARAQP